MNRRACDDAALPPSLAQLVYKNLRAFTAKKKPDEDIFDTLTPTRLNDQVRCAA